MSKTVAIIGGAGFIGVNLTEFFIKRGYSVRVISRQINPKRFNGSGMKMIELDVSATTDLIKNIRDCETVVWLVSALVPGLHQDSLVDDYISDVQPLVRFLEGCRTLTSLKRFIFLSSGGTIYGDPEEREPILEDQVKDPISIYGLSKMVSENYIQFLTRGNGFQSFILRPSNVYGVYQNLTKPQGIIGFAFRSLLEKKAIDLYNDGEVVRDFVYVTDMADAIFRCAESELRQGYTSIYNVGSQEGHSIKEMIGHVEKVSGCKVLTIPKSARNFDCMYNVLSADKIRTELGWAPETKIEEGLKAVWNWIKSDTNGK